MSIHYGEDKTKCILFGTKHRLMKVGGLGIRLGEIHIKQYHVVTYLGCSLEETFSWQPISLKSYKQNN